MQIPLLFKRLIGNSKAIMKRRRKKKKKTNLKKTKVSGKDLNEWVLEKTSEELCKC